MIIARCPFTRAFTSLRMPRFDPPKIPHLSPSIINSMLSTFPSDTIKLTFFIWCANHPNYFHAPTSFDLMLPVALRLNDRLGSISAIVDELESNGCPQKPKSLMLLLRIYWKGGMYKLALHVFDEMTRRNFVPNTYARNIVIDVLFKMGHYGEAIMFFRDTQTPNFLSFNTVLCHLSKLGDWLGVHVVLREMVKKGFHFNSGTFLVSFACFNKAGRVTELLQLLGFMIISGEQVSVIVWTNLIDCYCRVGRVDIATWLLIKMVDSGSSPNVVTYTSVIKGLSESGMHHEVFEVFSTMLSKGCAPDLVLYNVLIDSMKKARRYDDAVAIFLDLRKRKIEPDSYTLSSLMSLLSLSGKMSLLPRLVAGVDVPVDLVACNSLLHSLCKAGFLAQALEFYRDMIDKGFTPDGYTFVGLLSSLCKLGMIDNAVNVYYALVTNIPDIDAYVHTAILGELFKRGKYQRGSRLFREAVSGNYCLDAVSYTIAIHGLFQGLRILVQSSIY